MQSNHTLCWQELSLLLLSGRTTRTGIFEKSLEAQMTDELIRCSWFSLRYSPHCLGGALEGPHRPSGGQSPTTPRGSNEGISGGWALQIFLLRRRQKS